jgi:hypothetical protein
MQLAAFHLLGAALSLGVFFLGRFLRRDPRAMVKFFTFGASDGTGFFGLWGKFCGWMFLVLGAIGMVMYLILIPVDLISSH